MVLIVSAAVPVLVSLVDSEVLAVPIRCEPKASVAGLRLTAGAGVVPVPLSVRLCGLPAALSEIVTLAVRPPAAVGVNVAEIVQVPPGASVAGLIGQSFDSP